MTSSRKLGRCLVLELEVPLLLLSRGVAALHHQLGGGVAGGGGQTELQGGKRKCALCCAQCNNCTWYSTTISTKTQRNVLSTTKKAELNVAQFRALDSSAGEFFLHPPIGYCFSRFTWLSLCLSPPHSVLSQSCAPPPPWQEIITTF